MKGPRALGELKLVQYGRRQKKKKKKGCWRVRWGQMQKASESR